MSTVTPPPALQHPELAAEPAPGPDDALASVSTIGARYRDARTDLEAAIKAAVSAGATEKAVTEASGLANMTVRRILGKSTTPKGKNR